MTPAPTVPVERTLKVSEIFSSIQGEGASAGAPAIFLRLALCNLRCIFCDTKYTWDFSSHVYEREVTERPIEEVAARIEAEGCHRLVVTGGEPLLQAEEIGVLLDRLGEAFFVEVETNGTLHPGARLLSRVNQWNVSPKLSNSAEPERRRIHEDVLSALRESERAWLKLVIGAPADLDEADALVSRLGWPGERVLLMPLAATREALRERTPLVAAAALSRGYRTSPRLHIEQFGGERGR